jgi:hypothetical protein
VAQLVLLAVAVLADISEGTVRAFEAARTQIVERERSVLQVSRSELAVARLRRRRFYSMFLSHIFSLGVARWEWQELEFKRDSPVSAVAFAVLSIALAVVGAVDVYRILEVPMLVARQRLCKRRNSRRVLPAAPVTDG